MAVFIPLFTIPFIVTLFVPSVIAAPADVVAASGSAAMPVTADNRSAPLPLPPQIVK
jgi:hypothetical protein